jgi:cytochrome c553
MRYVSVATGLVRVSGLGLVMLALTVPVASAAGNPDAGKAKVAVCAGCHGTDGNGGADPAWPKLAGQHENYIARQLQAFKSGARKDPIMSGMATPLSQRDIEDIAAYYSSLTIRPGMASSSGAVKKGEHIYRGGNSRTSVSACMSCHGPSGHGVPPRFPKVSGQNAIYTQKQLLAFKSAKRLSDGDVMTRIALRMSEDDIKAVSEYMAGLYYVSRNHGPRAVQTPRPALPFYPRQRRLKA